MMRRQLLTTVSFLALSGVASAADLPARMPAKSPIVAAPAYNWTGLYVGVHGGAQWLSSDFSYVYTGAGTDSAGTANLKSASAIFGGQVGYNWRVSPGFLLGVEADISWANHSKRGVIFRYPATPNDHFDGSVDLDVQGSIRARLGWMNNNWLFYATGGGAFGRTSTASGFVDDTAPVIGGFTTETSKTSTRWGWTAGAGIDVILSPNWIAGVEYRYTDLGSESFTVAPAGFVSAYPATADYQTQTVTVRLNYKF